MGLRTNKRRRKENKTDYKLRRTLLKSDKARVVIRRTNKYFIVQLVESSNAQDKVISGASSKHLIKYGWDEKYNGSLKSISAGYLTGLLFGNSIKDKSCIIDLGMTRTLPKNRSYALIKGLVDAGLKINVNDKIFPDESRLMGEHLRPELKEIISKVKSKVMSK